MFKTFSVKDTLAELEDLKGENNSLHKTLNEFVEECKRLQTENFNLRGENSFLRQRNKELRQKTWFQVYEENLKLQEEIKQYHTVLKSVETFINQYSSEKKVSKECH